METIKGVIDDLIPNGPNMQLNDFPLYELIDLHPSRYYTYQGGLTTPPCNQAATWIISRDAKIVTEEQVVLVNILIKKTIEFRIYYFCTVNSISKCSRG